MSEPRSKRTGEGGFKALLVLGAIVSIMIAVWGLVWTGMLGTVLGIGPGDRGLGPAAAVLARLYGGAMLAIGIGYALAAAQPQRSRGLLVPLFVAPLVSAASVVIGVARGEVQGGRGWVFVIYNLAYCFLYFRLYPRVQPAETPPIATQPPDASPKTP